MLPQLAVFPSARVRMSPMLAVGLLAPVAWLLGTFPTAGLVARARSVDITSEGSGNPGASNVARVLGWRWGLVVLLTDAAKGALACGAGLLVGGRPGGFVLGFAAVVGHTFPLYRKGGRGVATAAGVMLVLYPLISLGLAVVWLVIARVLKKASLASLTICVAFPILVAVMGYDAWEIIVVSALAVLIILRHLPNIRRLVRREEHDLNARRQ
jgi:acyl phosphate:glycerol-3-phosphate acyltransferase